MGKKWRKFYNIFGLVRIIGIFGDISKKLRKNL